MFATVNRNYAARDPAGLIFAQQVNRIANIMPELLIS